MAVPQDVVPTPFRDLLLVCRQCGRKGFGQAGKQPLARALKTALRDRGQRRQIGIIGVDCLGVCPRKAVTACLASRPDRLLVVPRGQDSAQVLHRLGVPEPASTPASGAVPGSVPARAASLALLAGLALALALPRPAGAAAAQPDFAGSLARMAGHTAVYALHLGASPKNNVTAATGQMNYQVIDSCEGWATQQHLVMDVTNAEGQTVRMISDYATWESKNGHQLRFRVRQTTDTAVTLQLAGQAEFPDGGGKGAIHYSQPHVVTLPMAAGTLFPMAHTAHILALAATGQQFLSLPLFDGSSDSGTEDTFVAVTGRKPPVAFRYPSLAAQPSTRVAVSFFDHDSTGEQPDYQVAMRYWANGVADDLAMNFGDFTMDGTLSSFTPQPAPHC